jgi:hypothetical protein
MPEEELGDEIFIHYFNILTAAVESSGRSRDFRGTRKLID